MAGAFDITKRVVGGDSAQNQMAGKMQLANGKWIAADSYLRLASRIEEFASKQGLPPLSAKAIQELVTKAYDLTRNPAGMDAIGFKPEFLAKLMGIRPEPTAVLDSKGEDKSIPEHTFLPSDERIKIMKEVLYKGWY